MKDLKKLFAPPQESLLDIFWRLQMIKDCMSLPDPSKLKAGIYHQGPNNGDACKSEVTDTGSVGFAPTPFELKSFKVWNKEQRDRKVNLDRP